MNHSDGKIVTVDGQMATVRFARGDACAHCGACDLFGKNADIQLENRIGARVGDRVRVELEPGKVVGASALAYAVPLLGLLIGLILGNVLGGNPGAALGGLAGVAVSALILIRLDRRLRSSRTFSPVIAQVLPEPAGGEEEVR